MTLDITKDDEQRIYIYIDDSGTLHQKDKNGIFVYAGYVFLTISEKDSAKRRYRSIVKKIQQQNGTNNEIKAYGLDYKWKKQLFGVMKYNRSLSVVVKINEVFHNILQDSKSICRYKDYVLKRIVKKKLEYLVGKGELCPTKKTKIYIFVDEQLTASNGYYSLCSSIMEEINNGIVNYDYITFHKPIFTTPAEVEVCFCDSKNNYLIQASDILANRIRHHMLNGKEKIGEIPEHINLILP